VNVYFDSSALVAVYVNEAHSASARAELRKHVSVPWTPLHDLEVRNAFRLLHGRDHIDSDELQGFLAHVDQDLDDGRLARPALELDAVFRRAGHLSEGNAGRTLARTLDILNVAAALELRCTILVSGDGRQIALAETQGMRTFDIRIGRSGQ
jgi:predicted nucleic acid-binding protein